MDILALRAWRLAVAAVAWLAVLVAAAAAEQTTDLSGVTLRVADQAGQIRAKLELAGALEGAPYQIEWSVYPAALNIHEALKANAVNVGFAGDSPTVSAIAGEGTKMERDYDFDSALFLADLRGAADIGRHAGERAAARVNPRQVETQKNVTVVFDPRVSRGFAGHIAGAINGASVA